MVLLPDQNVYSVYRFCVEWLSAQGKPIVALSGDFRTHFYIDGKAGGEYDGIEFFSLFAGLGFVRRVCHFVS